MRPHHPLLELAGLLLLVACGVAVSSMAAARFGWIGYPVGFVVGFLGPVVAVWGIAWTFESLRLAGPTLPPCHTGRCRGSRWPTLHDDRGDYQRVTVRDVSVLRCKCGRDYAWGEYGRRFMERLPDGTLKPYMVHKDYRGWFPDTDDPN